MIAVDFGEYREYVGLRQVDLIRTCLILPGSRHLFRCLLRSFTFDDSLNLSIRQSPLERRRLISASISSRLSSCSRVSRSFFSFCLRSNLCVVRGVYHYRIVNVIERLRSTFQCVSAKSHELTLPILDVPSASLQSPRLPS